MNYVTGEPLSKSEFCVPQFYEITNRKLGDTRENISNLAKKTSEGCCQAALCLPMLTDTWKGEGRTMTFFTWLGDEGSALPISSPSRPYLQQPSVGSCQVRYPLPPTWSTWVSLHGNRTSASISSDAGTLTTRLSDPDRYEHVNFWQIPRCLRLLPDKYEC